MHWRAGRRWLRRHLKSLVYRTRTDLAYRVARFYVNTVDNLDDCDWLTNGEARVIEAHAAHADLVFDVGAARGEWTDLLLAANPRATVHCFEPSARFTGLATHFAGRPNVALQRLAVADKPGEVLIHYGTWGGSNSLYAAPSSSAGELVPVTTLDAYCADRGIGRVGFVKLDIEGSEAAALRGARGLLRDGRIDTLQFEYSNAFRAAGESLEGVMTYVRELNPAYRFHRITPDGMVPVPAFHEELETFRMQNWLIVRT